MSAHRAGAEMQVSILSVAGIRGCSGWHYGTISCVPVNSAISLSASSKRAVTYRGRLASF